MGKGFTSTLTSQQKTIGVSNPTDLLNVSFLNHFEALTAPRIERSKEHLLIDIVAAILAVIRGADGWGAIELYGKAKYEWLKGFLELPKGIPSHDTFSLLLCSN